MKELPQLLVIGGATRNVGKTTLTCRIIEKFSKQNKIIGVKIKTIYENDNFFHGKDKKPLKKNENFRICEEKITNLSSDGEKMLKAGAERVFKIKTKNNWLKSAFVELQKIASKDYCFICESNSLVEVIKPSVYILIMKKNSTDIKPSAKKNKNLANKIIFTDGKNHDFNINDLSFEKEKWIIK